ncbi:M20/M25/M40 family metallo-hydrolase [Aminipila butyrica]|uniref:M20/M25/M40 family metallo-hydrolase n=1 Tax=Aminipila butyrica TaxID=433296 RepID=A0A858BUH1_9FIRM|nr:M20/M25/M40 family metallo-hydrolase [Aminipila butyrica]QIB69002.1 M20/M25/M40 family metallo-hydrolase [Aminipila butyrica]
MTIAGRIEENLYKYLKAITHTGTALERNSEAFFREWFDSLPYLREHPELCGFYPLAKDRLNRHIPWALLKGQGSQTVILLHHTDTVDVEDFGKYGDLAYQPLEVEKLFSEGAVELSPEARADLESGQWLFGRGASDMKGGGCIHLSLFEEYCQQEDFVGNILLIGVPDEENLSAGMRSAVYLLKELREQHQLSYKLLLNVEPHDRLEERNITVYDGSVGKMMPVFLVRGKLAHVGQIYKGLNPVNLLSAIVRKTELNPDFIEKSGNTVTPPPAWLYFKDRKETYDVSLPLMAGGYLSVLSLEKSPKEIFEQLKMLSLEAFEEVLAGMKKSYEVYRNLTGRDLEHLDWKPEVKYYGELYRQLAEERGEVFQEEMTAFQQQLEEQIQAGSLDRIEGAYRLMENALTYDRDSSPLVVIALAPPYYPSTNNAMLEQAGDIDRLLEKLAAYGLDETGCGIYVQNYFTGISDLSYAMFTADEENIRYIQENMMFWGDLYHIPLDIMKEQSMPVLNLGPWGKDLHKSTERVYKKDLFENIPKLVDFMLEQVLRP